MDISCDKLAILPTKSQAPDKDRKISWEKVNLFEL